MRPFGGEAQSKATRAYTQSGQYHIIVASHVDLTWYQSPSNMVSKSCPKLSHVNTWSIHVSIRVSIHGQYMLVSESQYMVNTC